MRFSEVLVITMPPWRGPRNCWSSRRQSGHGRRAGRRASWINPCRQRERAGYRGRRRSCSIRLGRVSRRCRSSRCISGGKGRLADRLVATVRRHGERADRRRGCQGPPRARVDRGAARTNIAGGSRPRRRCWRSWRLWGSSCRHGTGVGRRCPGRRWTTRFTSWPGSNACGCPSVTRARNFTRCSPTWCADFSRRSTACLPRGEPPASSSKASTRPRSLSAVRDSRC